MHEHTHTHSVQRNPASPTSFNSINQLRVVNLCVAGNDCWASPALKVNLQLCLSLFTLTYPSDPANSYTREMQRLILLLKGYTSLSKLF